MNRNYAGVRYETANHPSGYVDFRHCGSDVIKRSADETVGIRILDEVKISRHVAADSKVCALLIGVRSAAAQPNEAYRRPV